MQTHVREATYAVVDVETTGVDRTNDRVVEVACVLVRRGVSVLTFSSLVNPGRAIPARATAVHSITDADVADAPALAEVGRILREMCAGTVVVAHNAAFDRGFLPMLAPFPGLCTMRLARHLFPNLPSHANQALRYALHLRLPADLGKEHRALSDAQVTAALLGVLLDRYTRLGYPTTTNALLTFAESKVTFPRFGFGRYRNVPIPRIPGDYLQWMLRCGDPPFDNDIRTTITTELRRRSCFNFELAHEAV